jgi:dihydrofolate reductase
VTLDGVMEAPENWVFEFMNDAIGQFKISEMREVDTLLLGRATHQIFAESWPSRQGELADLINRATKYVVSAASEVPIWNNSHRIRNRVIDEITELKQSHGKDILVAGSGVLVRALTEHHLIDEYRLLVAPIVLGTGKRLFNDGAIVKLHLALKLRHLAPAPCCFATAHDNGDAANQGDSYEYK